MTAAIALITIPRTPTGSFMATSALVHDNDGLGDVFTGSVKMSNIAASMLDADGVKSFHVWQDMDDSFLTLIEDATVYNPNPLNELMNGMGDIEKADESWEDWDAAITAVANAYPRSLHGRIEPCFAKVLIVDLMERMSFEGGRVDVLIATQGTADIPEVASRIAQGWSKTRIQRTDPEAGHEAAIDGGLGSFRASELLYRLASIATMRDALAGLKLRSKGLKDDLGKALRAVNCAVEDALFWPIISLEVHPAERSALLVRGWLFHLADASNDEDENAPTTFTRSLKLISEGTLAAQDLLDAGTVEQVIAAFEPDAGGMGMTIKEPELVRGFLVGTPFGDLGDEADTAARILWRVSEADPNIIQGALALRRSRDLDLGDADGQGVRTLFASPSHDAPAAPPAPAIEPEPAVEEAPTVLVQAAQAIRAPEGSSPVDERVVQAPQPRVGEATEPEQPKRPDEGPAGHEDPLPNLEAILAELRKRMEAKPSDVAKIAPVLRVELRRAAETGAVLGYARLIEVLVAAGFADIEETSDGLVLGVGGVPGGIAIAVGGPDDVLHPEFQAHRVVAALQPKGAVDLAVEAAADQVLGQECHYLFALIYAFSEAGGQDGEKLVQKGAGLEELLTLKLLGWLIEVKEHEGAFANQVLTNAPALDGATGLIRDTIASLGGPDGEEEAAGAELDLPAQAERIWKSDLKNGQAFLHPPKVPSTKKAAAT